jgi:hypothetical protein
MSAVIALIAALTAASEPLAFLSEVRLQEGRVVRLADVADLSPLPSALRERVAATPVARLTAPEQALSSRALAARARAAAPALAAWLPDGPDRPIRAYASAAPPAAATPVRAARPDAPMVRAGDVLTASIVVGPVVVEREVRALQAGRAGRSLFVRTADGAVLTARLAADR